jgi:hypothetical protein
VCEVPRFTDVEPVKYPPAPPPPNPPPAPPPAITRYSTDNDTPPAILSPAGNPKPCGLTNLPDTDDFMNLIADI